MNKNKLIIYLITLFISMLYLTTSAQNKISILRYDDDFSYLKNDSLKKGFDKIKFIPLGNKSYISFGGELREQFQFFSNINFGDVPPGYKDISPNQLWHRFMLHSNLELGNHFRFFIQLNNTLRFLNDNPVVPQIDENQLSLHQAFAEIKIKHWKLKIGRQELLYGNNRLITVRDGPNTRLTFDGIQMKRTLKYGYIDFFAVSPTVSGQHIFEDESFKEGLIGIYGTEYFSDYKIGMDYYVVDFQSRLRKYNYKPGFENRQTYGLRLFSNFKKINFEMEGAYQSGKFNNLSIDAYNVFIDLNLLVIPSKKGIMGISANAASGDENSLDNKLNTYNLLFAKPAYGLAIPVGSTNMISFFPYIKINPIQKLNILAEVFFLQRNSNQDGTYSPLMSENRPRPNLLYSTKENKLGELYVVEAIYQQTKRLSFSIDASYFKAASYPIATGKGKDITYLSFKTTFKF